MEISKYWIMGGRKNLIINGWVRYKGGADLKLRVGGVWVWGNPFQNNFGAAKDTYQNFCLNAPKILSKCIPELPWQNWHKIHFLLHFHACSSSNNSFKWIIFSMCWFTFWVLNCLKIGQVSQKPYWISFFFFVLIYKQLKQFAL